MLAALLLPALSWAQDPVPELEALVRRRFLGLPREEQERVAAAVWDAALAADHPLCRAAAALERGPRLLEAPVLDAEPARAYDAAEHAPALRLKTRIWQPDDAPWRSLHRGLLGGRTPPPQPAGRWRWDPGRNVLLRPSAPPPLEESVLDALRGEWPADARLTARAQGALDTLAALDPVADYFEHAYRNRDGGVYAGVRLWDVWDCGRTFEVSDVEAIAWLRTVGGDERTVSPIPGERHEAIYARIKESFLAWREPWSLRLALAARMLGPAPVESLYAGAAATLDAAWVLCEHDPERMNALLAAHPGRDAFLAAVAAEAVRLRELDEPPAWWTAGWEARASAGAAIAGAALAALRDEGLLGLGGR